MTVMRLKKIRIIASFSFLNWITKRYRVKLQYFFLRLCAPLCQVRSGKQQCLNWVRTKLNMVIGSINPKVVENVTLETSVRMQLKRASWVLSQQHDDKDKGPRRGYGFGVKTPFVTTTNKEDSHTKDIVSTQRIGVISLKPFLSNPEKMSFPDFYAMIGKNTGNYMFTVAMYRQLAGTVMQINFSFNPENINSNYDAVVIPCANWLNSYAEWDWLVERLERLEIPIIPIGLGLQADHTEVSNVKVSASAYRLAHVFARKAKYISVRGDFTASYLRSIGINNIITTGCPSIYMRLGVSENYNPNGGLAISSTRYYISKNFLKKNDLNRRLFEIAATIRADMIYQSEPEELQYLLYGDPAPLAPTGNHTVLTKLYGFHSLEQLIIYLDKYGHFFTDLNAWQKFVQGKSTIVGTRLHGSILSLNSGVPAVLFTHDSRTSEIAEFACLPTANPLVVKTGADLISLPSAEACGRYIDARTRNGKIYRQFLQESGLDYLESALF